MPEPFGTPSRLQPGPNFIRLREVHAFGVKILRTAETLTHAQRLKVRREAKRHAALDYRPLVETRRRHGHSIGDPKRCRRCAPKVFALKRRFMKSLLPLFQKDALRP